MGEKKRRKKDREITCMICVQLWRQARIAAFNLAGKCWGETEETFDRFIKTAQKKILFSCWTYCFLDESEELSLRF